MDPTVWPESPFRDRIKTRAACGRARVLPGAASGPASSSIEELGIKPRQALGGSASQERSETRHAPVRSAVEAVRA